jgi:hypothetical protein
LSGGGERGAGADGESEVDAVAAGEAAGGVEEDDLGVGPWTFGAAPCAQPCWKRRSRRTRPSREETATSARPRARCRGIGGRISMRASWTGSRPPRNGTGARAEVRGAWAPEVWAPRSALGGA